MEWAQQEVFNSEKKPYDHSAYPHHGAPGGPMDAWDCQSVREISLQWGTRLGKTFFAQVCFLWIAANDPAPCMHANATERLCTDVLERLYMMIGFRPRLESLLTKRRNERRQDRIDFVGCKLVGAWSKSVSTLADKNVKVGHAAEIDKWVHPKTSREAHPLSLFSDRFKDYWSHRKAIYESTPTIKGNSSIEERLERGTYCRLHVPCRKCQRYQILDFKQLRYDKPASGRADSRLAYQTAHYECRHCKAKLFNGDRAWMIRRGVWCPRGSEVLDDEAMKAAQSRIQGPPGIAAHGDDGAGVTREKWTGWRNSPWIKGLPHHDGDEASYQLSSLYALSLKWGDIAKEWVESHESLSSLRNFVNQWLAETWELRLQKSTANQVAKRLGTALPARTVPAWAQFLTLTVDQQAADGGFAVWLVMAHGPQNRSAVVAHGNLPCLEEVYQQIWSAEFPAEDGGLPYRCSIAGVDSGWNTLATYRFVNRFPQKWFALKGSATLKDGEMYHISSLEEGARSGATGQTVVHVPTNAWEEDLDDRLHNPERVKEGVFGSNSLSVSSDAADDDEFLAQLLNGVLGDGVDAAGNPRNTWKKRYPSNPNDFRDCARYGLCLGKIWVDAHEGAPPNSRQTVFHSAVTADEVRTNSRPSGGVRRPTSGIRRPRW